MAAVSGKISSIIYTGVGAPSASLGSQNDAYLDTSNGNLYTKSSGTWTLQVNLKGVPAGGTTGQVLAKASNSDYDVEWVNQSGGGGAVDSVNGQTGVVVLDTDDVAEGSANLYYTIARFNSAFAGKSTTDLAEGTNLYYTISRFNSAFSAKSTTDLSEGSNLYFTNARARSALSGTSPINYDSSTGAISLGTVPIANGGTGQVTASSALNALLPNQTGNSGTALITDGSNASWQATPGTGTVTNISSGDSSISITNSTTTPDIRVTWPLVAGAAGTAGSPAITWGGSGIYQSGFGLLNFSTSGIERLRLENNGDVIIAPGGSGTLSVNGDVFAVDGNFSGNISAANYPPPPPTGTANTFAGFDGSGFLYTIPGFNIDTTSGGQNISLTMQPNNGGGATVHQSTVSFEPLQNSPAENWNVYNFSVNMDAASSGKTQGTNGNAVQFFNMGFNHQGTGNTGALIAFNISNNLGNGTDPITIGGLGGMALGSNIQSGVTINGQMYGFTFNPTMQTGSISGASQAIQAFWDGSQIQVAENNHVSFLASPGIFQINNNANYNAFQANPVITTLSGNAGAFGLQYNPTITTASPTGAIVSFTTNPAITTMGASGIYHGIDIYGNIGTSHGFVQGITVAPTINGGDAQFQGLVIGPNGSATLPFVRGAEINLSQLASSAQKIGLTINDGKLEVQSNYATDTYPASPGFLNFNQIGSQYWVKPGFPTSSTAIFANSNQGTFIAEDDVGPDPFGGFLGYAHHVNIVNGGVAVGKTVDTYTGDVQAFSVADLSGQGITDGGTLTNAVMYLAGGLAPSGGSIINTNLYGFKTSPFFGAISTNKWGFYDDSGSDNYMQKLALGTSDKKVFSDSKLSIGDQTVITGDNHANIRNSRSVTDPVSYAVDAGITNFENGTFTNDSPTAIIGFHNTTKVTVASGKTIGGLAGIFNGVSRAESGDDGTVPFAFGMATGFTSGNSSTKVTSLYAGFFTGFNSIDSNANQVGAMYDFYAQSSSIGSGAVTNRYGIVIEADSGYTKQNWLSGLTLVGGSSITTPTVELDVQGDARIRNLATAGTVINDSSGNLDTEVQYKATGTRGSPTVISAGSGITAAASREEIQFIVSDGGAITLSANPQVSAGTFVGQRLYLKGTSNTDSVQISDGNGLELTGSYTLIDKSMIELMWDGTIWGEVSRNGI